MTWRASGRQMVDLRASALWMDALRASGRRAANPGGRQ